MSKMIDRTEDDRIIETNKIWIDEDGYVKGDFRSKPCLKLLSQADIVITNPPFSLFREYINHLIVHNKKFLVIGNKNCITYKECFKHIKNNTFWLGYTSPKLFYTARVGEPPYITESLAGLTRWFTNPWCFIPTWEIGFFGTI
jgi:hypothetical protein